MTKQQLTRVITLLQRELLEYRRSLLWTPLMVAAGLAVLMLISVLMANRISAMGTSIEQLILQRDATNVSIRVDGSGDNEPLIEYRVERRLDPLESEPGKASSVQKPATSKAPADNQVRAGSLNPLLNAVHTLFLFILILVCANYLLATLFTDRRDRSILFWKSMPVSERQSVLSKFGVALVVAPVLFVAASLLAQVACVLLAMLLVWRMEMDPFRLILQNLDFSALLAGQLGGWLLLTLWIAPTYAWLLLASAAARRSPFMMAVAPLVIVLFVEKFLFGTAYLSAVISRHLPHYSGGGSAGFYWLGFTDLPGIMLGLAFAAVTLAAAIYLRRYRFEI